jgi:hypothetical protein
MDVDGMTQPARDVSRRVLRTYYILHIHKLKKEQERSALCSTSFHRHIPVDQGDVSISYQFHPSVFNIDSGLPLIYHYSDFINSVEETLRIIIF